MKYILIESIEAYEYSKKFYNKSLNEITWITTSPFLVNYFSSNNIRFIKIEESVSSEELNDLQKICTDFNDYLMLHLNNTNSWKNYIDFKYLFSGAYHHYISVMIYKCLIINKIVENFKDEIIIVGDPYDEESINSNNILYYSRFANIYAILAKKFFPKIKILKFEQDKKIMLRKHLEVKEGKMNFQEKLLSLLNKNFNSIFFKIFLKLNNINLLKKIKIFYKKKKKQIVIYEPTDTIECSFTKFLRKGYEVKILTIPNIPLENPNEKDINEYISVNKTHLINKFENFFLKYKNVKHNHKFNLILESTLKKIIYKTFKIKKNFQLINKSFEKKFSEFDKNHLFFSNYFFSEIPVLYLLYIKKIKNIKIVLFEHGVVQGLGEALKYRVNFNPMNFANIGIYSWEKSLLYEKNLSQQKILISGFSYKQWTQNFSKLKKILIKKYLKVNNKKKSIILVADIEKNNFISGPYIGTDLDYYKNTREIVKYLCENNINKDIYLKLYPTNRYMQNYDFEDLKNHYKNLKIIRNIDFRFVREFFEEIYISSYQSTLGWAISSSKPIFLIEREVAPINLSGLIQKQIPCDIKGITKIYLLNKKFKKDNFDWIQELEKID